MVRSQRRRVASTRTSAPPKSWGATRLVEVLARVSDGVVTLDIDYRYTYVSPRAEELLGRPASELLGRSIWDVFPEAVQTHVYPAVVNAMETQLPVVIETLYPPWGRWFENRIYPSQDGITIVFQDSTQRHNTIEALSQLSYSPNRSRSYQTVRGAATRA